MQFDQYSLGRFIVIFAAAFIVFVVWRALQVEKSGQEAVACHSACNIDPLSRGIGVQNLQAD